MLRPVTRPVTGPVIADLIAGGGWSPADLGASLFDMWDAEEASTVSLSGSAVTSWASVINAYAAVQGVGASRPIYSATSFNSRPGLTFDGADDLLIYVGQPFPSGTTPSEIWGLIDVTTPGATAGSKYVASYGGTDNNTARAMRRSSTASVNKATAVVDSVPSVEHPANVAGRHVWRAIFEATRHRIDIDGVEGTWTNEVPGTGTTRVVLGALQTGLATFFQGVMPFLAVTDRLTTDQAAAFTTYLKTRGGIA